MHLVDLVIGDGSFILCSDPLEHLVKVWALLGQSTSDYTLFLDWKLFPKTLGGELLAMTLEPSCHGYEVVLGLRKLHGCHLVVEVSVDVVGSVDSQ